MKKSKKPFAKYSALKTFLRMPQHKASRSEIIPTLTTIFTNFFVLQQKQKFQITDIPVVHVDHKLDGQIPFSPEKVKIYLDFIWFIMRVMSMLFSKLPKEKAFEELAEFERFISKLYKDAGSVYSTTLTTTNRPKYYKTLRFIIIHAFDPHLLCVPSLHVAIVAGTWAFVRKVLDKTEMTELEKKEILDEVYFGAVKITESVLYVKQHSINCVAGAVYMLTTAHDNNFFTKDDGNAFLEALFQDAPDIFPQDVIEIRTYMKKAYETLLSKNKKAPEWQKPILDWLGEYEGN